MSEQTAKPYLVRAIYEWCSDHGYTPYLAVRVNAQTRVPLAFVKNGEIVLNVSATATRHLKIDNDAIQFSARFNGVSHEVMVPMSAVAGIFARETGYGFAFNAQPDASAQDEMAAPVPTVGPMSALTTVAPSLASPPAAPARPDDGPSGPDRPRGKPNLQVIK